MENQKQCSGSSLSEQKISSSNDDCSKSCSNDVSHNASKIKICSYFLKYDYCKYEDSCKFLHSKHHNGANNLKPFNSYKYKSEFKPNYGKPNNSIRHPKSDNRIIVNKGSVNRNQECRYFKAGNCDKGDNCSYQHLIYSRTSDNSENAPVENQIKKHRVPLCYYFKKGSCKRGDLCKFYHQITNKLPSYENNETEFSLNSDISVNSYEQSPRTVSKDTVTFEEGTSENFSVKNILSCTENVIDTVQRNTALHSTSSSKLKHTNYTLSKKFYDITSISDKEIINLRDTEIAQFKKRYPKYEVLEENLLAFTFEPSDPDWPFDLKSLDLKVLFPERYPIEACKISVILTRNIPEILHRFLNQSISEWIDKRHEEFSALKQVEIVFRPFLKWFDKNLEELFICGLRKVKKDIDAKNCGIEFVPPNALFASTATTHHDCTVSTHTGETDFVAELSEKQTNLEEPKVKHHENFSTSAKNNGQLSNSALNIGVKVLFIGLELVEGAAALSCTKLAVTLNCIRCKTATNLKCIPGKNSCVKCSKCSKILECSFSPLVLHQFSNVAGNLSVVEGQVVDINLVESSFLLDCLNCSKQIPIDGLHYGQKQKRWCMFCNEKLIFSIESIKFQATSSNYVVSKSAPVKKVDKKKDPLIKEGEPLPAYGTCKHYKKSHRWLRFPCCGRLYPCDICHEEKEKDNHEMKFASRMVCGFCSKEQPYSKEKPCTFCSGTLTAKSGTHWEGGKGCRNKIKMARDDKHKYVGTSKTISKKASSVKSGKKK